MTAVATLGALLPAVPFVLALAGLLLPHRSRAAAAALGIGGAGAVLGVSVALLVALDGGRRRDAPSGGSTSAGSPSPPGSGSTRPPRWSPSRWRRWRWPCRSTRSATCATTTAIRRTPPRSASSPRAMLLVVVAGDLILLLVGWEVMGICSYLLIGHDRRLPRGAGRRGEGVPGHPGW